MVSLAVARVRRVLDIEFEAGVLPATTILNLSLFDCGGSLMEELHTDSIDGGHEASYGLGHVPGRGRTPTIIILI
jgi:hypothetical protein